MSEKRVASAREAERDAKRPRAQTSRSPSPKNASRFPCDQRTMQERKRRLDSWREKRRVFRDDSERVPQLERVVDSLDEFMTEIVEEHKQDVAQVASSAEVFHNEEVYSDGDLEGMVENEDSAWKKKKLKKKEIKVVDHSRQNYISIRKNFYIEAPEISALTSQEVDIYRKQFLEGVKIRGKNCPNPIKRWTQCGLPAKVMDVIQKLGYSKPFPIQAQAIPAIMSGRDVLACAKTGSGKTLAFVLPMLRHILDQPPLGENDGPIGLIVAPTRELAIQIAAEANKFCKPLGIRLACCYGGAGIAEQISQLKRGAEIVVGTPGRLIDMICANSGKLTNLKRVTYVVLDEADRCFDMGFEPQISAVLQNVRPDRQTMMFSATFPKQIEGLAKRVLSNPLEIIIGGRSVASDTIDQYVEVVEDNTKFRRLLNILSDWYEKGSILIFCDRKESVDVLFSELIKAGYLCFGLHGGMDQSDRDYTILDFKKKVRTVMVATSVAARGLDVKDLVLVVNYTCPNHYEDYIHRIGRTVSLF
jgi:ATP-dependent RNA helicase DDX46/PRP5